MKFKVGDKVESQQEGCFVLPSKGRKGIIDGIYGESNTISGSSFSVTLKGSNSRCWNPERHLKLVTDLPDPIDPEDQDPQLEQDFNWVWCGDSPHGINATCYSSKAHEPLYRRAHVHKFNICECGESQESKTATSFKYTVTKDHGLT